jgi:hypothetical protein
MSGLVQPEGQGGASMGKEDMIRQFQAARVRLLACGLFLFVPAAAHGQWTAREALSSFPADTHQMVYVGLAQVRALPNYPQMRQHIFTPQLRNFQEFLRAAGSDPEKTVDEVVLGWRGEAFGSTGYFGLAGGSFDAGRVQQFFASHDLPSREYAGQPLFAFGSGADRDDYYFTFLTATAAAFGRLNDLQALLDVRARIQPALETNARFAEWEAELEGVAPQWGIATGKAAVSQAVPWLGSSPQARANLDAAFAKVEAVLYRLDWGNSLATHASLLCQDEETAGAIAQLVNLLREARLPASPGVAAILQGLEVHADGKRVELHTSVPFEVLDQALQTAMNPTSP